MKDHNPTTTPEEPQNHSHEHWFYGKAQNSAGYIEVELELYGMDYVESFDIVDTKMEISDFEAEFVYALRDIREQISYADLVDGIDEYYNSYPDHVKIHGEMDIYTLEQVYTALQGAVYDYLIHQGPEYTH